MLTTNSHSSHHRVDSITNDTVTRRGGPSNPARLTMAYPYPPYMQAHPPPGYGAPGSTGYFTTQNLGGFYAPISSNPSFAAPQPQWLGSAGSGGAMFNCWPGAPQEQEKVKGEDATKSVRKTQRSGSREHGQRGRDGRSQAKTKKKPGPRMMRWEQVVDSLNEDADDNKKATGDTDHDDNDNDNEDDRAYDHCDYSASETCSGSVADSRTSGTSGDDVSNVNDGMTDVVIQPGGSAHVFVHLNRLDRSPNTTAFVVSARRMQSIAHNWPNMCHQGTNDYDVSATDEAAVLGMYWLLQVLHMEVEMPPEFSYHHGHGSDSDGTSNNKNNNGNEHLRPGLAPATTPSRAKVHPPAIPPELPARVLAYATLFAHQLGVLEGEEHKLLQTNNQYDAATSSSPHGAAGACRFRRRAETWMRAVTNNPRCRRTLDGAIVPPADWPYVVFTARVLGDRQLFAVCLRTLLERWWLNERGVFCDVNGPTRIDLLPEAMREIVLRDLTSFKNARERSVESIVHGAMHAFY